MPTVLIAGGATGIGCAVLRELRRRGYDVLLADVNEQAAADLASETLPGRIAVHRCDFDDLDAPAAAVEAAVDAFGALDVVFFNAAFHVSATLDSLDPADWDRTMRVNLRAPYLVAKAAAPHVRRSAAGRIIFTSSTAAFQGSVGSSAYCASKAALLALARCLAVELAPDGVTVNSVCPGWIDTPFNEPYWATRPDRDRALRELEQRIPLGGQGEPEDVVGAVLFLASAESRYVTGQAIVVDGGLTAA